MQLDTKPRTKKQSKDTNTQNIKESGGGDKRCDSATQKSPTKLRVLFYFLFCTLTGRPRVLEIIKLPII